MAVFQSDRILKGKAGNYGVYPQTGFGQVVIPANTTLTQGDTIELCNISPQSILEDFLIDLPALDNGEGNALAMSLQDDLSSPTVYVNGTTKGQSGGLVSMAVDLNTGVMGTLYTTVQKLVLLVGTTAGTSVGSSDVTILFKTCWAPSGSAANDNP